MPSTPQHQADPTKPLTGRQKTHSPSSPPPLSPPFKASRPLSWRVVMASPVLYGIFIPLLFLDLSLTIYHWTVFPLLKIPRIRRTAYIRLDRHHLAYLPWIVKLTCSYCGYANGLLHYGIRLAGDTEAYFCPMKHQQRNQEFHAPPHHRHFAPFGDAQAFQTLYYPKDRQPK